MAYGNWGAFVYKNDVRQKNREDNTPYSEDDLQPGYHQAFGGNNKKGNRLMTGKKLHCCHASLGDGDFRLCGYKSYPLIYWKGDEIGTEQFKMKEDEDMKDWWFYESNGIEGKLHGYKFKAKPGDDPEKVSLELIEPNGTVWKGESGYCMGSGFEE